MVNNGLFSSFERKVLNTMVSDSPRYKEILFKQLNNSLISREKTKYYSLTFLKVKENTIKLPENGRSGIILEMIIYNDKKITDVLLHARNGYIYELEIYNADSSEIDYNAKIVNYEIIALSENWGGKSASRKIFE